MNLDQAWQSALEQLQMEMPRASFDTWVRDTHVVKFDDGRLTIGVRNAYARDWLESRLASKVTRLLVGIMDQNISVQFVVTAEEPEPESEDQVPAEEPEAKIADDETIQVEADYELAYDRVVNPDHVTLVPRYFLRHLPRIGVDLGWLYFAFRQSAYNAGGRSGIKRERFSGKSIAALAGIAESTFWNRIGKYETWKKLRGLVTTTEASPEWDTSSSTPKRLPRRYIVHMTLPLTAKDAHSLRGWLMAHRGSTADPEAVIDAAVTESIDVLLPPDNNNEIDDGEPETVTAILRSLFGDLVPAERLATLTTRLHKHIMPDNDRVGVTHFFVEHILPHLGAGPGWMVMLLRDRGWRDPNTGDVRDIVRVHGGYAEVAGWLGVTPATIWRWLYGKHSESRAQSKPTDDEPKGRKRGPGRQASEVGKLSFPVLSVYVREVDKGVRHSQSHETAPRIFQVLMDEAPLEILEAEFDPEKGKKLDEALAVIRAVCSIEDDLVRAVCSIGFARFVDDRRAVCSIVFARFVDDVRAVCRVFKSLNLLNPISNSSPSPLPPAGNAKTETVRSRQPARGVGNLAYWDFNFLMKINQVGSIRALLRRQQETGANIEQLAQGFVSHLLYSYSPAGQRITDPVALAVKRLLQNINTGTGGELDRLARMRPFELKAFFDWDLTGTFSLNAPESIEADIYLANFQHLEKPLKKELYRRLFGAPGDRKAGMIGTTG
jgi:hypothetical protein